MDYPFNDSLDTMTEGKFATDATYYELGMTDPNATGVAIRGIFEDESRNVERGKSEVERVQPTLCVRSEICPNASNRDKIEIDGREFQIKSVIPDGTGILDLEMREL